MHALDTYLLGLGLTTTLLVIVWIAQVHTRDAGLVDVVWSASLGLMAVLYAAFGDAPLVVRGLLVVLAGAWSLRLAAHLAIRMRGQPEDSRYTAIREHWGDAAQRNMLLFFLFQAVMGWVLSLSFLVVAYRPDTPATLWLVLAVVVWTVSVAGEAIADWQLYSFKRNPDNRGKVCARGLWRYSRHPNYFFESLHWLTYVLLAIGAPYWWATLASPVLMAVLLLKVSGIPTVESRDGKSRREGYEEYARTTSAFIPMPPKR